MIARIPPMAMMAIFSALDFRCSGSLFSSFARNCFHFFSTWHLTDCSQMASSISGRWRRRRRRRRRRGRDSWSQSFSGFIVEDELAVFEVDAAVDKPQAVLGVRDAELSVGSRLGPPTVVGLPLEIGRRLHGIAHGVAGIALHARHYFVRRGLRLLAQAGARRVIFPWSAIVVVIWAIATAIAAAVVCNFVAPKFYVVCATCKYHMWYQ